MKEKDTTPAAKPQKFHHTTMSYVIDGAAFLEKLGRQGLSEYTIQSVTEDDCDSENDEYDDPMLSSFNSFSSRKRKRRVKKQVKTHCRESVRNLLAKSTTVDTKLDKAYLSEKLVRALEKIPMLSEVTKKEEMHRSYERLVNVCAGHIRIAGKDLHLYLDKMTLLFLKTRKQLDKKTNCMLGRFARMLHHK